MEFPRFVRIAITPHRHMLEVKNETLSHGVEVDFIRVLSQVLNFQYELHVPNKVGWSAMFDMVHRNQSDLGFGHAMVTERRLRKVDFIPYQVQSNTFATKLPGFLPKTVAFAKPFEWQPWLLFFVASFLVPFLMHRLMAKKRAVERIYQSLIGCYFGQPPNIAGRDTRDRILICAWMIYALILSSCYQAMLLSSLTLPSRERGITTIAELSKAVARRAFTCYALPGTASLRHLKESEQPHLKIIGRNTTPRTWKTDDDALGFPKDIGDNIALYGARFLFLLEYGEPPNTRVHVFDESIYSWNAGVAINKNFCCKKRLHSVISRIVSSGIYQHFYDMYVFMNRRNKKLREKPQSQYRPLTLHDLSGVFLLLEGGLALACAVFACESIHHHRMNKSPNDGCKRKRKNRRGFYCR